MSVNFVKKLGEKGINQLIDKLDFNIYSNGFLKGNRKEYSGGCNGCCATGY